MDVQNAHEIANQVEIALKKHSWGFGCCGTRRAGYRYIKRNSENFTMDCG